MDNNVFIDRGNLLTSIGYEDRDYSVAFNSKLLIPPETMLNKNTKEDIQLPFYPIKGFQHDTKNRLFTMLDTVISDYLNTLNFSAERKRQTVLFAASSSFDIGSYDRQFKNHYGNFVSELAPLSHVADIISSNHHLSAHNFTFNTACSSSAIAISYAANLIHSGALNDALIVAYEVYNPVSLLGFESLQLIDRHSQPFSKQSNGMILGESISATLLSNQAISPAFSYIDSLNRMNHSSLTGSEKDNEFMASMFNHLLKKNRLDSHDIQIIKAHGSGSATSDSAESKALRQYFNPLPPVTSFKAMIGNTLGASGLTELLLLNKLLNNSGINQHYDFPLQKVARQMPLNTTGYNLLNYFGFGGSYICQLVEAL